MIGTLSHDIIGRSEHSGSPHVSASVSTFSMTSSHQTATASSGSRWRLLLPKPAPKPHLDGPDKLEWRVKRSKLNKYIYKGKSKLLTCKASLEVAVDRGEGQSPKITIQLDPYGAEEDSNKCVTMKVSLELPKKRQLHSESEIEFKVHAKECQNNLSNSVSEFELGRSQVVREKVTRNFFYIKEFIKHEALKSSTCEYVTVSVRVSLVRTNV